MREEAFKATVDGKNVSRAWNQEFYRLANKIYFETNERQRYNQLLKNCGWQLQHYSEILPKNRAKRPMMLRSPSGNYIGEAAQNSK